ncbi:hypothetical protein Droror1_Dr00018659 [Drosera rotundifolia]
MNKSSKPLNQLNHQSTNQSDLVQLHHAFNNFLYQTHTKLTNHTSPPDHHHQQTRSNKGWYKQKRHQIKWRYKGWVEIYVPESREMMVSRRTRGVRAKLGDDDADRGLMLAGRLEPMVAAVDGNG